MTPGALSFILSLSIGKRNGVTYEKGFALKNNRRSWLQACQAWKKT
jgi:hypothetical protein